MQDKKDNVQNKKDVTIVIPTKNAGKILDSVLNSVFSQETTYTYEVICVDSGSSDGTLETIRKYPAKLYQIKPEEFGHGRTRNYGASKGTGEYIVFITQDALPASNNWLQNFIDAMKLDDEIVAGFGIHYPYPDCNIIDKRDLEAHFKGFGTENTIYQLTDRQRYENDPGYRHFLSFFSDNNSCIKRSIFEKFPYDDVDFAEDQIWARRMIEQGYKKVYCPYAPVYHSHNYNMNSYFGRYYDEHKGLYQIQQYINLAHAYLIIPAIIRHVKSDKQYFETCGMNKAEEKAAVRYSIGRNYARYFAGYLGGHYHNYPHWIQTLLDRTISQQYKQRKK